MSLYFPIVSVNSCQSNMHQPLSNHVTTGYNIIGKCAGFLNPWLFIKGI